MRSKISQILTVMFILLFTPATAMAATLGLNPQAGTFNRGCEFTVSIDLDTQNVANGTDGTDAILHYDPTRFTTNNSKITPNTSVYPDFPGTNVCENNELCPGTGKITISGLASVSTPFTGKGKLATITFTVLPEAQTTASGITFDFDPNNKLKTTDTNVVQRGTVQDVLSSVTNGNYTVGTGTTCAAQGTTGTSTSTGTSNLGQGATTIATPSAQPIFKTIPVKTLPPAGSEKLTFTIAILGSVLTVLGILGLALL